jgi:hypothetical protein
VHYLLLWLKSCQVSQLSIWWDFAYNNVNIATMSACQWTVVGFHSLQNLYDYFGPLGITKGSTSAPSETNNYLFGLAQCKWECADRTGRPGWGLQWEPGGEEGLRHADSPFGGGQYLIISRVQEMVMAFAVSRYAVLPSQWYVSAQVHTINIGQLFSYKQNKCESKRV